MTNTTMERLIAWLVKWAGTKEGAGNSNPFGKMLGRPPEAWCGDFLDAGAHAVGLGTDRFPECRSVQNATNWGRNHSRFTRGTSGLRRGDLLIVGGPGTHIELALSGVGADGRIERIGGNTNANGSANGDGVYHDRYRRASSVYGYVRPDYPADSTPVVPVGHGTGVPVSVPTSSGSGYPALVLPLKEDGDFGPPTAAHLQSRLGVEPDGVFGPDSINAWIRHEGTAPADGVISGQNAYCKKAARAVRADCFLIGSGGSNLVRKVQGNMGMAVRDGLAGPDFWRNVQHQINVNPNAFRS